MITVLFFLWDSFFSSEQMMYEVRESRPEVGSSRKMTWGSDISSKAIEVLFF